MKTLSEAPIYLPVIRGLLRYLFRGAFNLISRPSIEGLENIPSSGSYLLAFNHVSLFESPFIVAYWPTAPEILGASEIWERPGQAILARLWKGIPVQRGEVHRDAMKQALNVLRNGLPLMLAPEGGRSHVPGLRRGKPGIVYLVERTKCPIVPVGVEGMPDDFIHNVLKLQRPPVSLKIGLPFSLPDIDASGISQREIRQQKADFIMMRIAELLPPEYRGVYS